MKKILSLLSVTIVSILLSSQAHALFEARVSYGLLATNADLGPLCPTCSAPAPSIVPTYGLGADAILTLPIPLIPGVGIRYENMGLTASSGGVDFKADYTRTALILNWRPIDNFIYLGPILTYGISHTTKLKAEDGGVKKADFSADSVKSYSVGLEGGLKLIGFSVGAEIGYLDFRWNDAKDSTGNAPTQDINMSGTYAKFILGFSI
nr:hypothetical protein [uncultured Bdellovibrio sp.]